MRERLEGVHIFAGQEHDLGRIVLLPGTRFIGRLVDSNGRPLSEAGLKLELYRHQLGHTITSQGTEWKLSASADGRFRTPPLPAGDASFCFSASGKVRTFVNRTAEPGAPVVYLGDVILPDEMLVAGVVVDQDGNSAPKVEVVPDYDWQSSTTTDQNGRFAVHGVGKDIKMLQLRSNYYFSPKPFDVTPGRTDLKLDGDQGVRDPWDSRRCRDG